MKIFQDHEAQHEPNIKRFKKKISANSKNNFQTSSLPNDALSVQATSTEKVPGSKAVYRI
ncbi:MAG: hypothetical protein GY874_05490 [Desulfobacteraceae bacterium]|nr:hypothetical protein [Desulfobacteraceae bacterium]